MTREMPPHENRNESLPITRETGAEPDSTPKRTPVILAPLSPNEQAEAAAAVEIFRHPLLPRELARSGRPQGNWLWHCRQSRT